MNPFRLLLMVLLLPVCTHAGDLYHVRRLSESELARTYTSLLLDACRHADKVWQDSATDPRAAIGGPDEVTR